MACSLVGERPNRGRRLSFRAPAASRSRPSRAIDSLAFCYADGWHVTIGTRYFITPDLKCRNCRPPGPPRPLRRREQARLTMPDPDEDGASDLLIGSFRTADRAVRLDRESDDLASSLFGMHAFSCCPRQGAPPEQTARCVYRRLDRAHPTENRGRPCH
jgi:hypothetical protein